MYQLSRTFYVPNDSLAHAIAPS